MKVGVLANIEWPLSEVDALAEAAGRFGFDQIWINEHPLDWDPFLVLDRISARAPGVPLGIGTINPWARHPAVIAASAATLANSAGVPFALGLGSGAPPLFPPIGIELKNVIAGTEEAVRVITTLVAGDESNFEGSVFQTAGARLTFPPKEPVSVLLGVSGGPRMLRVAGEYAEGVIVPAGNYAFYQSVVADYMSAASSAGRVRTDEPPVIVVNGNILVGDAFELEAEGRSRLAHSLEYRAKTSVHALERMAVTTDQARRYAAVPDEIPRRLLEESIILGPPKACVERLRQLESLGVTQYVLRFPSMEELTQVGELLLPGL
jgi:alkanesulfonate monooxygenase SsuD/methylene tetrahydromethanopterin reductase-like flavin-dependent oxidoreductase (luciferase family)